VEGKFYCKVYLNNGIDSKEMELSVSDAISLSLSYKSKIYVSEEVINSSSILMDNNGVITKEQEEVNRTQTESTNNSVSNIENLKIALDRAIEEQDFETAAKLRDRIIEIQSI
jgi:bifunctional DNase/RNase